MDTIITREQQRPGDTWNLSSLYESDDEWESDLRKLATHIPIVEEYLGTLHTSVDRLQSYLELSVEIGILEERLGHYAMLKQSEDAGNSSNQERFNRFVQVSSKISTAMSFFAPELQQLPEETIEAYKGDAGLKPFLKSLEKVLRYRPYTLSPNEEKLLSMQVEVNQTASRSFDALVDVDFEFGEIETPDGPRPLSQSSFSTFMESPDRDVRQRAFTRFYQEFAEHKNVLATLYTGSVNLDIYRARVRGYSSALQARLFPDDVSESVYENLVTTVRGALPTLHRYYGLRKRILEIDDLSVFDTKVPLVSEVASNRTYDEAVDTVIAALSPLGTEYTEILKDGLRNGWVDRYENKGKRSGAFSAGSYVGDPYILMNYKEDSVRDTFTLAHEAGHSMHSWYSVRSNPFQDYDYTIFEAEVASTFNEQLLMRHLLENADSEKMHAYLLNKHLDDMLGTLFRQTMFAEFERNVHIHVESDNALSLDWLRGSYRNLLADYFGPEVAIPVNIDLEGLRIPHFYRSFYVYKYATGISAAIALSERVLTGGARERDDYFAFLASGGSRYPIESLRLAGVDMSRPEPIEAAVTLFGRRVDELAAVLGIAL